MRYLNVGKVQLLELAFLLGFLALDALLHHRAENALCEVERTETFGRFPRHDLCPIRVLFDRRPEFEILNLIPRNASLFSIILV